MNSIQLNCIYFLLVLNITLKTCNILIYIVKISYDKVKMILVFNMTL